MPKNKKIKKIPHDKLIIGGVYSNSFGKPDPTWHTLGYDTDAMFLGRVYTPAGRRLLFLRLHNGYRIGNLAKGARCGAPPGIISPGPAVQFSGLLNSPTGLTDYSGTITGRLPGTKIGYMTYAGDDGRIYQRGRITRFVLLKNHSYHQHIETVVVPTDVFRQIRDMSQALLRLNIKSNWFADASWPARHRVLKCYDHLCKMTENKDDPVPDIMELTPEYLTLISFAHGRGD